MKDIQITLNIPLKDVRDLLVTAFEQGSTYWAGVEGYSDNAGVWPVDLTHDDTGFSYPRYAWLPLVTGPTHVVVSEWDDHTEITTHLLTRTKVVRALTMMGTEYPRSYADFINTNGDATTADVFLQLCLFGEVKYG